ncbi:hypothetical protein [Streptomyces sp. TRM49041]|uniref:hypothetical protein n=1 Tax=Streptomyces sp. TRM49041 TaxID=2603216 RepID=UPI0011ECC69F|nr:hypothetical protein [Streptomyces sp. TRM49041]
MTGQPHAIRIDTAGALREIPLGDTPRDQARAVSRALLDAPAVIRRIDHPDGSIVVIGGKNREQHPPNLHASLLAHALGGPAEDLRGSVVFAGLAPSDRLIPLPGPALTEAREICTTAPGQLPEAGPTTPIASHRTTEKGNS